MLNCFFEQKNKDINISIFISFDTIAFNDIFFIWKQPIMLDFKLVVLSDMYKQKF